MNIRSIIFLALCLAVVESALAEPRSIHPKLLHLRIAGAREWSEFPPSPDADRLEAVFNATKNAREQTLRLRQQDVKQSWNVSLNGKLLGRLRVDENDMVVYFPVPAGALADGKNTLRVEQNLKRRKTPDDIRVGEIVLDSRPKDEVLSQATVEIVVDDLDHGRPTPARITIINEDGALQTTGAVSNEHLAVRPGIVYTSTGSAVFGLPAGKYTVWAGRGFEYSLGSVQIKLEAGERVKKTLSIRREVPTEGYVACDTHVHTLTHSRHGDATVQERMVTLAAEGIELPIATDHNVHVDHRPFAERMKVRRYFTPVIGNEVTTRVGHFNIFPVRAGAKVPDYKLTEWGAILKGVYRTPDVKIAILNHPRDLHGGTRPFGPKLHNALAGENIAGWPMRFNAMEVINSGATQTDVMQLFHDWMALLNRGLRITPVGSSDSHDVGRHFVGQGRTYIRCDDRDAGNINIGEAVDNFRQGQVMVSYGLMAELTVDEKHRSGELAILTGEQVRVGVRVLGPNWVSAAKVMLFANGTQLREAAITTDAPLDLPAGVKWQGAWSLPRPKHDMHLVAVAVGPGIDGLFWKTAKPYQPTSPHWRAHVIGCSGAVWLDADGDGRPTPAYDYARRLAAEFKGDLPRLITALAGYDEAVAVQAAHLLQSSGQRLLSPEFRDVLKKAAPPTRAAFRDYLDAWRETQQAAQ